MSVDVQPTMLPDINTSVREETVVPQCFDKVVCKRPLRHGRHGRQPHSARPSKQVQKVYLASSCEIERIEDCKVQQPLDNGALQLGLLALQKQVAKLQASAAAPAISLNQRCCKIEKRQDHLEDLIDSLIGRVEALEAANASPNVPPNQETAAPTAEEGDLASKEEPEASESTYAALVQRMDYLDERLGRVADISHQVSQAVRGWCGELKTEVAAVDERLDKVVDVNHNIFRVLREGLTEEQSCREQMCVGFSARLEAVESLTSAANLAATNFVQECHKLSCGFTADAVAETVAAPLESVSSDPFSTAIPNGTDDANVSSVPLRPPSGSPTGRPHSSRIENRDPGELTS